MTEPRNPAYLDGLRMLARRELSEAQVRDRLGRRGHDARAIDAAVARLRDEQALDDGRVAEALARFGAGVKGRGRRRVQRQIESAGIAPAIARRAVDAVFEQFDDAALLEAALNKRLRGRTEIADEREAARLYRALLAQGFASDGILRAIRSRLRRS